MRPVADQPSVRPRPEHEAVGRLADASVRSLRDDSPTRGHPSHAEAPAKPHHGPRRPPSVRNCSGASVAMEEPAEPPGADLQDIGRLLEAAEAPQGETLDSFETADSEFSRGEGGAGVRGQPPASGQLCGQ